MYDYLLFVGIPYASIAIFVVGLVYRYAQSPHSFGAKSSEFLGEKGMLAIGVNLWHIGIGLILGGHFVAFILTGIYKEIKLAFPQIELFLDISRWSAAAACFVGLVLLLSRRLVNPRLRKTTSKRDWLILLLFLNQIIWGTGIALLFRNEPFWFDKYLTEWLQSLLILNPVLPVVEAGKWFVYVHALLPFLILAILPFTKLVHMVSFPFTYIWRPYRQVIWNIRTIGRHPET